MTTRRSRGDGGLFWDESRQRWLAQASLGFDGAGKRIYKRASGKTKTEAKEKLKEILRDHEDGLPITPTDYTVAEAVTEWLEYGLSGRDEETKEKNANLCRTHILPYLGARKLRDLTATEVDRWLAGRANELSTSTLRVVHSALNRSVRRAMARDKVKRNVVELCDIPEGQAGRPSKALTMAQATAVLECTRYSRMYPYICLSLLTGARTEELRALTWDHVDLLGDSDADPPKPPHIAVWRSVRASGETKTRKSRRTVALPERCIDALSEHRRREALHRADVGAAWNARGLVFCSEDGGELDAGSVRKSFRTALKDVPGIDPEDWTPREMRHSFVSVLSDGGVSLEEISRLVGHRSTVVTELVYRHQIRPVIQTGAVAMDRLFGPGRGVGTGHSAPAETVRRYQALGEPREA